MNSRAPILAAGALLLCLGVAACEQSNTPSTPPPRSNTGTTNQPATTPSNPNSTTSSPRSTTPPP